MAVTPLYPTSGDTEVTLTRKILLVLLGGGAGLGTLTSSGSDPTGVLVITGQGWCSGTGALEGKYWKKVSAGTGSDWSQV